jgi:hypothetical protein
MTNTGTWWLVALGALILLLAIEAYAEQARYDRRHGRPTPHNRRKP